MNFFRTLSEDEKEEFRQWARENYTPGENISSLWHPVIQETCHAINEEIAEDLMKLDREDFQKMLESQQ